ncbi:MAG: amidohydrolase family protein [Candidatus Niyogibacteria bacterium]|nr:amidohydrolase family protein [Candidatus Niyogibacteria bacterium]
MPRSYSVIIRNGLVFDGAGLAPAQADIGIDQDTIRVIGNIGDASGLLEIDASNRYVAPGFIDLTNHSDTHWTLFDQPRQESLITQGITTIVGGNCGTSLVPLAKASDIEGIQKWTDISRVNVNWRETDEFLNVLDTLPLGVNVATLVGHGTLRRAARVDITHSASADDIATMNDLLRRALDAGAFGLSTGLGRSFGLSAEHDELEALFASVKRAKALTAHHLADEGAGIVAAMSRIVGALRETGAVGHISHFKAIGRKSWPLGAAALDVIENARSGGIPVTMDVFPYTRTGSNLYLLLPEWAMEGGRTEILARLENSATRVALADALRSLTLHYDRMVIASTVHDVGAVGHTIADLALRSERTPEDVMLELLRTNQLQVAIFNEAISEDGMAEALLQTYAAIASDGVGQGTLVRPNDLPHPRSFGAFPRAIKLFVKERRAVAWKDMIQKMTGLPASILGLRRRGWLRAGMAADIIVFDPEMLQDRADYAEARTFSEGMEWVFINGRAAIAAGEITRDFSGRALRRGGS